MNFILSRCTNVPGVVLLGVVIFLTACAGTKSAVRTNEYLDETTGITVTVLQEPAIFFHASPRLAANVRDYLYVGPVEMNRMGKLSHYLWLAEWSTIDRAPDQNPQNRPIVPLEHVSLLLDGSPMELQDPLEQGNSLGVPLQPYSMPVETMRSVYMRVSRDQLSRIAAANKVMVVVVASGQARTYKLWNGDTHAFGSIDRNTAVAEDRRLVKTSD
jgi:hypothetical protein